MNPISQGNSRAGNIETVKLTLWLKQGGGRYFLDVSKKQIQIHEGLYIFCIF